MRAKASQQQWRPGRPHVEFSVTRIVGVVLWLMLVLVASTPAAGQVLSGAEHFQRGMKEYREGLMVAASVSFTEAIALKPDYAEALVHRGLSFEGLGQAEAALRDYRAAVENSRSLLPYQKLFAWCRDAEQHAEGVRVARLLVRNVPDNAAAGYWEMGNFHELLGQTDQAIVAFRQILRHYAVDENSSAGERAFRREIERKLEALRRP